MWRCENTITFSKNTPQQPTTQVQDQKATAAGSIDSHDTSSSRSKLWHKAGWRAVQHLWAASCQLPSSSSLPHSQDRFVAKPCTRRPSKQTCQDPAARRSPAPLTCSCHRAGDLQKHTYTHSIQNITIEQFISQVTASWRHHYRHHAVTAICLQILLTGTCRLCGSSSATVHTIINGR